MQKNSKTTVIIDIGNPKGDNNGFLNEGDMNEISHTLIPMSHLAKAIIAQGDDCISPDIFLADPSKFQNEKVLLISQLANPRTARIIAHPFVTPLVLTCQESPYIATKFYLNVRRISSQFKYSMLFSGMKKHTSKDTVFVEMHFPIADSEKDKSIDIPFEKKKNIILVAGNKGADNFIKTMILKLYYGFTVKLIYPIRKKIVSELAEAGAITIYGRGWDNEDSPAIRKAYQGLIPATEKLSVMRGYKYALCLENCQFEGYITEKIFDALNAGIVPIYLGAPDIKKYLPDDIYIDMNAFSSTEALLDRLENINAIEYAKYKDRINDYLGSREYSQFKDEKFIKTTLGIINSEKNAKE